MSYTLTFSQLIGEFTTDKEALGAQDPYVIFEAGGRKCQTKAIKSAGAGTCEWKETYTLQEFTPKSSSILEVTVYNHNTLRPDGTMGSGTVNLSNLGENQLSGSGDRITVPLTDKKGKSVGALKFIVHGGGFSGTGRGSTGSGVSSGTGYGSTQGTGAGYGSQSAGYGSGSTGGAGIGSGTGQVTGVGAGSDYNTAKYAADKAARENRDVTVQTGSGTAAGRPVNTGGEYDETSSRTTGTTTGTTTGLSAAGVRGIDVQPGEVIDRKYYTGVEDRPQEQALVEQYREHNPYAKQYETTVQHTGRERLIGTQIEALGTTERVVGTDHHVHAHPHDHIARALPKGAIAERPGGEGWVQTKPGPICESSTFEVTGDRTVDKERVTNLREHREFEKEFEVKTALTGERNLERGADTEQLNRERILIDEKSKNACEGHPAIDGGLTGSRGTSGVTGTGSQYGSGVTGTGTGSGYGSGVGTGSGTGIGSGTGTGIGSGTGTGVGSGTGYGTTGTGSGYGATGTGSGSGYGTTGTGSGIGGSGSGSSATAGMSTTQKIAALVPGTEANKEKKAAQGYNY